MSIFTRAFNKFGGYDELAGRFSCAAEPGAGVPQLIGLLAHVPTKNPCSEA